MDTIKLVAMILAIVVGSAGLVLLNGIRRANKRIGELAREEERLRREREEELASIEERYRELEIGTVLRYIGDEEDFYGAIVTVQGFDRAEKVRSERPVRTDFRPHLDELDPEFVREYGHCCHQPEEDKYIGFYLYTSEDEYYDDYYGLVNWEIVETNFWRLEDGI